MKNEFFNNLCDLLFAPKLNWENEYKSQEERIKTMLKDAGYVEASKTPDYLGSFTTGEPTSSQFYKWLDGKYMIRIGAMLPKTLAMETMTYNIIFYNGNQTWGKFFDTQALASDKFLKTIEDYAEKTYNELKEKDNGRI